MQVLVKVLELTSREQYKFDSMKLLFFVVFCPLMVFSQPNDASLSVAYLATFKDRHSQDHKLKEYFNLLIKNDKSSFQTYNERELDTLKTLNKADAARRGKYFSFNKYSIFFDKNDLTYYETVGNEEYQYEETIELQWNLLDETREIKEYTCKKATTNYGGRKWIAWYTTDIPVNAGPYKFKGLPGLIMKITDVTNSYDFDFYGLRERSIDSIYKLYHTKPLEERIQMKRLEFNKFKQGYESLSLNQKINYGNTGQNIQAVRIGSNGETTLRDFNSNLSIEDINLIEVDHL